MPQAHVLIFHGVDYEESMGSDGLVACVKVNPKDFDNDVWYNDVVVEVMSEILERYPAFKNSDAEFEIVYPDKEGLPYTSQVWRCKRFRDDRVQDSILLNDGSPLLLVDVRKPGSPMVGDVLLMDR